MGDLYRAKGVLKKKGYHTILQRHALWSEPVWSYNKTVTSSAAPNYARTIWEQTVSTVSTLLSCCGTRPEIHVSGATPHLSSSQRGNLYISGGVGFSCLCCLSNIHAHFKSHTIFSGIKASLNYIHCRYIVSLSPSVTVILITLFAESASRFLFTAAVWFVWLLCHGLSGNLNFCSCTKINW